MPIANRLIVNAKARERKLEFEIRHSIAIAPEICTKIALILPTNVGFPWIFLMGVDTL